MDILDKVTPQNTNSEQAVLGCMLIDDTTIPIVCGILNPEDFYHKGHQTIFKAIINLQENNLPVDLLTVEEVLQKWGKIKEVGEVTYLVTLINTFPVVANVEYYARQVLDRGIHRSIIKVGTELVNLGYSIDEEHDDIIGQIEQKISKIKERETKEDFSDMSTIVGETFRYIEKLSSGSKPGIMSGFNKLDELTAGFQPGELIIFAARPGMGKTAFALNIVHHVAVNLKMPVGIFSIEMSKEQLAQRMLCSKAKIDGNKFRTGGFYTEEYNDLIEAMGLASEAPIFIDDHASVTLSDIRSRAKRMKTKHGIKLLVIDYIQLIVSRNRSVSRNEQISEISRGLKILAKELNIPIIALSQLSRNVEQRGDKRPHLSDLRDSGAIEQDADVVGFIHREDYYSSEKESYGEAVDVEIIISKQRNGPLGTARLRFSPKYTKFENSMFR